MGKVGRRRVHSLLLLLPKPYNLERNGSSYIYVSGFVFLVRDSGYSPVNRYNLRKKTFSFLLHTYPGTWYILSSFFISCAPPKLCLFALSSIRDAPWKSENDTPHLKRSEWKTAVCVVLTGCNKIYTGTYSICLGVGFHLFSLYLVLIVPPCRRA